MKFTSLVQALFLAGSAQAYKKCNYNHADVAHKEAFAVRIVFVGDKLVSGEGDAPIPTDESVFDVEDATDGSHWGHQGFPFTFGELLKEKKPKQKFEIMNFGGLDYGMKGSFFDTCDYQKSLRSEPSVVVMAFGDSDIAALKMHEDRYTFINKYIALGKEYLSLPSQPQVYIVTPPALKISDVVPEPVLDDPIHQNAHYYSAVQIPTMINTIADALSLPAENRIDLFTPFGGESLSEGADLLNSDKLTPNAAGNTKISEILYNSMIKLNNFANHEELYKVGRKTKQDPNWWGI